MNTRKFSQEQENRIAKKLGGKVVSNSGATRFNKGDVRANFLLIECKTSTTPKDSFSIKLDWLEKNQKEAFSMGLSNAVLAIDFGQAKDYFIIDERLMKLLLEKLREDTK